MMPASNELTTETHDAPDTRESGGGVVIYNGNREMSVWWCDY